MMLITVLIHSHFQWLDLIHSEQVRFVILEIRFQSCLCRNSELVIFLGLYVIPLDADTSSQKILRFVRISESEDILGQDEDNST